MTDKPSAAPQGKHICCWERENPHRCILCCQCGKKFEPPASLEASDRERELDYLRASLNSTDASILDRCIQHIQAVAYRRGQEEMRERAAQEAGKYHNGDLVNILRALPVSEEK
jgi:hypothetical protein